MEAEAKHDFTATANDELSFARGSLLKILSMDEDRNWYKAELDGKEGYIPSNYIDMKPYTWYVNKISRIEAECMLLEKSDRREYLQRDGAFLVRPSETSPGDFSLSVKFGDEVQHFKVLRDGAGKYFLWVMKFDSLNQLVQYHRSASVSRSQTIYLQDMNRDQGIANYDYKAQDPEELELKKGDQIVIISKNDPHWWTGEMTRGSRVLRGVFPASYVSISPQVSKQKGFNNK